MILRVTQYGEPILRQQGQPVKEFGPELKKFADDMLETMYSEEGIGLAAQQVDCNWLICVFDVSYFPEEEIDMILDGKRLPVDLVMPMVLVNPEINVKPGIETTLEEGCLSFPGIRGDVTRPDAIHARFQDLSGNRHELLATGIVSRVIQHEVDHLQGRLFIDHFDRRQLRGMESKLKKLKRRSRDFLESKNS